MEKGEAAVKDLESKNLPGTVELVQLDVANEDSIVAAAKAVESKHGKYDKFQLTCLATNQGMLANTWNRLDALVNNAGVATSNGSEGKQILDVFTVNALGPHLMMQHFAPLLKKSTGKARIINVTSGAGSIQNRLDPNAYGSNMRFVPYRVSKAAFHMVHACMVAEFREDNMEFFLYGPGFTESNFGSRNKVENGAKPTNVAVKPIIEILMGERPEYLGRYLEFGPEGIITFPW
jgi:NAD(P)-dependent dehydrogenase (short-subunit alcohol dehydrogenase family)